ncbi:MAG: hypothetical protein LRS49_05320 [Desulfurococcales archaeon]|nr:hypothetical protein [Desulfurococcales archaeon]
MALLYTGEPGEPGDEVYAATAAYMASRGTLRLEPCDGEEGLAPGGEPSRGCE